MGDLEWSKSRLPGCKAHAIKRRVTEAPGWLVFSTPLSVWHGMINVVATIIITAIIIHRACGVGARGAEGCGEGTMRRGVVYGRGGVGGSTHT